MKIKIIVALIVIGVLAVAGVSLATAANPKVELDTTKGKIVIELFPGKAPETVKNFLNYVDTKYFDGTIFHRVIRDFMIQGGGFTEDMSKKKTRPPIKNEAHNRLKNVSGTIAMARTRELNSATAQFFINVQDNRSLDHRGLSAAEYGYAVFGRVISGMDVVDQIREVKTTSKNRYNDVPVKPVVIQSVRRKAAASP